MLMAAAMLCMSLLGMATPAGAQPYARTFPETGKTASGALYQYWVAHGGLPIVGYPISEPFQEISPSDGVSRTVQYFERAELELHPDNAANFSVMPALLGDFAYDA